MTHNPYILFRQTAAQLRRVAARGGRASARNRRARLRAAAPPPPPAPRPQPHAETTAAAIAALDAQFPWLLGAGSPATGTLKEIGWISPNDGCHRRCDRWQHMSQTQLGVEMQSQLNCGAKSLKRGLAEICWAEKFL